MVPGRFEYFRPSSLQEAVELLAKYPDDSKVLSGGQSLVSLLKLRMASPAYLVDLNGIPGLDYIRREDGKIAIGATARYADALDSKLMQELCPLLPSAAAVVGDVQIRNRGTVCGCVAHADPAGDVPAAILALDADIKIVGPSGERWVKATDFFLGMYATLLEPTEILAELRVPVLTGHKSAYMKAARRPSDFAIAGVAVWLKLAGDQTCQDIAIAITGITDRVYRATAVEQQLKGKVLDAKNLEASAPLATEGVEVIGNMHASPEFRTHLTHVYVVRTIQAALDSPTAKLL